jgi:hypothetical protein
MTASRASLATGIAVLGIAAMLSENRKAPTAKALRNGGYALALTLLVSAFSVNQNPTVAGALQSQYGSLLSVIAAPFRQPLSTTAGPSDKEGNLAAAAPIFSDSIHHRIFLFQQAWTVFKKQAGKGIGLDAARVLGPHNSYLLFGLAYGSLGLLIVPLGAVGVLLVGGVRKGFPAAIAVSGISLFSDDIFLTTSLVSAIGLMYVSVLPETAYLARVRVRH